MNLVMTRSLRDLHDALLAEKPEGAVHESDSCPFCAMQKEEERPSMSTYTEDELRAKVDEAVKAATDERDAKIAELTKAQASNETEAAVQAAVEAKDSELAGLRSELDTKVLEAANAVKEHADLLAFLEASKVAAEQAALIATRKETRLAKLKEVASFPDDYLNVNLDRFAAMSDEDFESNCAAFAALSKPSGSEIPSGVSGLLAGQEASTGGRSNTAVKELFALRRDPRGHVPLSNL
jgi:hypothetical protein